MINILLSGISGVMGQNVCKVAHNKSYQANIVAGVDINANHNEEIPTSLSFENAFEKVDCIVDFSYHTSTADLIAFALKNKLPVVIATTGQTEEEKAIIVQASKTIPIFFAANYSLGIALLIDLAKQTAKMLPDAQIEIIEKHHIRKADAPSGTALAIANAIQEVLPESYPVMGRSGICKRSQNEIGIHSLRMGNIVGEHEVIIATQTQTITLKHEAHSRELFAEGALLAAQFIVRQGAGLYTMKDYMNTTKED